MGLFDFLSGRTKLAKPNLERLFAMSTAAVTLEVQLGLRPTGKAAVCFKPLASRHFRESGQDLRSMVESVGRDQGTQVDMQTDSFGYEWAVFSDSDVEDLVTEINMVAQTLTEDGQFGEQLLCAVFAFEGDDSRVRLIYNFKRGLWYPFVEAGPDRRDNARELDLQAKLEKELPLETELERWFPLYGAPV